MLKGCYKNKIECVSIVPVITVQEVWDTNPHALLLSLLLKDINRMESVHPPPSLNSERHNNVKFVFVLFCQIAVDILTLFTH